MEIRKIILIHPGREGRIFGKASAAPYTLMRLASLVPDDIEVEIWDENWEYLDDKIRTLGKHDLVGITSKTLAIETAERYARIAHEAGVQTVVVGGAHATLIPEDVARWADVVVTGEAYYTWPQIIKDFQNDSLKPHYNDTEWADLTGVAPLTDRVIAQKENRLIPGKSWRYYDTAHVTYYPRQMTVEEFEREYDRVCRTIYHPFRIAQRGLRALSHHPIPRMPAKVFGSFSTDYGYRRTFAWRHAFSSQ